MKKTMTYVLAAAAVVIGLVSCSKTKLPETEQEKEQEKPQQGLRTLTVSFAAGTKTTLGANDQPVWAEGDKISLDGVDYVVPEEAYGKPSCTITTDKQGSIKAVYPADAYDRESPYYKVADSQDGSFGSANICYAQVGPGETTISFDNVTAVFEVEVPAHTKKLVVTSLGEIDATGQRGTTVRPINSTGSNVDAKQKITVTVTDSNDPTTCYVSVLVDKNNPVLLTNLNFDAAASETAGSQGGFSPLYLKETKNIEDPYAFKIEAGTIYNLPAASLHPYVVIDGKKWATMNVGATSETETGYYFFWGGIKGYKHNGSNWVEADATPENVLTDGFVIGNDTHYDNTNSKYTKYTGTSGDNKSVLDLADDAANVNWGGAWRMPTQEEFHALCTLENSWETNYNNSDVSGNKFTDAGNSIFLPAAGRVDGTDFEYVGKSGCYWSSSLYTVIDNAHCLTTEFATLSQYLRYQGLLVRAVSNY